MYTYTYACSKFLLQVARDKAVKDAIAAGEVESIKKLCASVPTVLLLPDTSSSLGVVESSEVHEHAQERAVYQKKWLLRIEKARASRGVGGTNHGIVHHSQELAHSSSNSDRAVYQKKWLLRIEKARASRGVGGTNHGIVHHSQELAHSSSNSDTNWRLLSLSHCNV